MCKPESDDPGVPFTEAWYDAQFAAQSLPAKVLCYGLIFLVRCYQCTLRAVMGGQCRFTPTCSAYAIHAIKRHGPIRGGFKAAYRILRCNPWGGCGWDPA